MSGAPTSSLIDIPPADTPPASALFGLAVGVVVVVSLYVGRQVLIPITLAALLSFVLAPLVHVLRRLHLGRVGSVLVAMLAALGIFILLSGLIGTQIASLADDIPRYRTTIDRKVQAVETLASRGMATLLRSYARSIQGVSASSPTPPAPDPVTGQTPVKPTPVQIQDPQPTPFLLAQRVLTPILGPLSSAGIILIVALFLLLQQEDLRDRMIRLFGSRDLHRTTLAIDDAAQRLSRYFLTQLGINTAFGIVICIGLALIGVPSPILWGVIAALLRFVPYIGSPIAAVLPLALAAAVAPGWSLVIATASLFLVVEMLVGQVVEPMMYSNSTGLSPFSVIVAAIFWSWLWGPIGLILSTPVTLCLVVLGRHVQRLEFLDVLLGDRPALSPVESFYQRMLAGDPDEAQAHAELLLRDRALSAYYDEVALKGMILAANDAARGVLAGDKLTLIGGAMNSLIDELDQFDDTEPGEPMKQDSLANQTLAERRLPRPSPPPHAAGVDDEAEPGAERMRPEWRGGAPVLCIAGRGPLDHTAARMLAQLLGKHDIGARVVPHGDASRASIASLDLEGVAMVCVTYLEVSGMPSNLRYLLARLRRRLPTTPLLVGMWTPDDPTLRDPGLRAALGADLCVPTLRDAVQACLDAAQAPAAANDIAA